MFCLNLFVERKMLILIVKVSFLLWIHVLTIEMIISNQQKNSHIIISFSIKHSPNFTCDIKLSFSIFSKILKQYKCTLSFEVTCQIYFSLSLSFSTELLMKVILAFSSFQEGQFWFCFMNCFFNFFLLLCPSIKRSVLESDS